MRSRFIIWIFLGLLILAVVWFFLPSGNRLLAQKNNSTSQKAIAAPGVVLVRAASTAPVLFTGKNATNVVVRTNEFAWRLSNTSKTISQLMNDPHAILLENAFIDTAIPLNLGIPKNLQSQGDPGAYIVQARGPLDNAFRATLAAAGAGIVSYIPNNAYLVTVSSGGAAGLAGQPQVQSVIPYEPYYKISSALIGTAAQQKNLPDNSILTLGLFADTAAATVDQIKQLGGTVVATDQSPFGPILRVAPPSDWTRLAILRGVQIVELAHRRKVANDLSRVTLGISTDTVTNANYRNLNGSNILVEVNDTGIDATHPDFSVSRVSGAPSSLIDTNGHGTFVAGIIAGNGSESSTINTTNTPQGSVTNANFRGKAPAADLYSFAVLDNAGFLDTSDYLLQLVPATNHALISNNSWTYDDDTYNLASASYDAAVRDALPLTTGSQPVLFVFAAGNDGGGDDNGGGGFPDSIQSPGTAKDVITVGALEQLRNITNMVTDASGNSNAVWQAATSSDNEVAGYSGRGNVGIGVEGPYGRFKPDVVAPGSFVVSTRSKQWDQAAYYNPTNYDFNEYSGQIVQPGTLNYYGLTVPANAVGVTITILPNDASPSPFPSNMPIYVSQTGFPTMTVFDFMTAKDELSIPEDTGIGFLQAVQNGAFNFAVGNSTNFPVNYDLLIQIVTTNEDGNYFEVLSNLNNTLAPFYRYESGTSMAAPAVSGTLALIQDYFINHTSQTTAPSPALLKALLINGSRSEPNYEFSVTNTINLQGWGLPNVPAILPYGLTNSQNAPCSSFFLDQSPTNALATGQSQTFMVTTIPGGLDTQALPLRVTLAWTDPPGNPAAAIKLVNNLDLVVTNLDTGDVYWGNDFNNGSPSFIDPWNTNTTPNVDAINNVENVYLAPLLGENYSVTVIGRSVNVNAVTAQTNNVVQDYALVISSGDGEVTNGISVTALSQPPLAGPVVTIINTTNTLLINQFAGANTPLLGTNTVGAGAGYITNAAITVGMTNQWHFYMVTNSLGYTNAAFITFLSQTLATPRMGVFADESQNPTQPDADVDLYVADSSTDPLASSLTNLNPIVLSNCVNGLKGDGASLANGTGTEFVAYTNGGPAGKIFYIGVKSETQVAAEYDFLPVFSQFPFSEIVNGSEVVNGLLLPVGIPDGTPKHPGVAYIFALAVQPIQIQSVIVSNQIVHQNLGDLVGVLSHGGVSVVLNNHNSFFNPSGIYDFIYDDSPRPIIGSQPPDGPGSLNSFQGQEGTGPWILTETDNSLTQTGSVTGLTILIAPHAVLTGGGTDVLLPPTTFFYGYVDVPAGATNLTIAATNITINPPGPDPFFPGQLFEELGAQPTTTNFDKMVVLNSPGPLGPGGIISVGPSDVPPIQPGRYFVTLYNPSTLPQEYHVEANISLGQVPPLRFGASGPTNLLDDAVMYSSVFITNTLPIASLSVGLRVDHPRISDLVFHLISPDGTRYLLMENRGALSTNGCGVTIITTNDFPQQSFNGGSQAVTNVINVSQTSGTVAIDYDFFTLPDQMTVYYQGVQVLNLGPTGGSGTVNFSYGPGTSTNLTIIMNEFGNPNPTTAWTYTIHSIETNYYYLTLTQDTNLTTTPIKFAPPPFVPLNFFATNFTLSDFESIAPTNVITPASVNGWNIISNQVSVVSDPTTANQGSNYLALANGVISNNIATVPGANYTLNFAYRGPGIVGLWRGEGNGIDSINGNNGVLQSINFSNGIVNKAFAVDPEIYGGNTRVEVPDQLIFQLTNSLSIEGWIRPRGIGNAVFWRGDSRGGYDPYVLSMGSTQDHIIFQIQDALNNAASINAPVNFNQWNHVAATLDGNTGLMKLFVNGALVNQTTTALRPFGPLIPGLEPSVCIGNVNGANTFPFEGDIDEISLYSRAISTSEILAIYQNRSAGKFDTNFDFPQNLAEASVAIPGVTSNLIFGDNTNWQQQTISFTATGTSTPIVISGLEPGMLLDSFTLSGSSGGNDLYYLPEQSLDPLIGTSPYGLWQLEIQDDRVGATNHTVLDSWQLQFVFAQTNPVPADIGNGSTNFLPAGGLAWYQVDVPTNADFATNILTFATGPLNMWYSTNMPPTITNAAGGDTLILPNSTNGSVTLGTNGYPNIVPGGTYYLGIQNPGTFTVQYGVRVDFHLTGFQGILPFAFTEPATLLNGTSAQLNGMATPNGSPATAWFQWGSSRAYGNNTPAVNVGTNYSVVFVSTNISGLMTNMAFHYRLAVSNLVGVTYGFDQIFDQGNLVAWGADFKGQTTPIPSGLTNLVVGVGAGYDYSLALNYNGTVVAWGDDSQGQTNVPVGLSNAVAVAGGVVDSLALCSDRTVKVWGSNLYGQTNVPSDLTNAIAAASGSYHCLALRDNGNPVAWGSDTSFQTNIPPGLTNVVAVAAGEFHSLALINDGTVVAWGNNAEGETNIPPGLTNVVAISAGYSHNLALKSDGTVAAWGFNGNGQTNVPFGLTNVMAISAGGYHCLALRTDGTVVFWGDSGAGQTNFYPANLINVFTIAGGGFHTLAVSALSGLSVTNTPPYWTNGLDSTTVTMSVLTTKLINNAALDSNAPPQIVFYSFANNPPPFASIDAFTGLITLAPQAGDGPSTNIITTVATDNGYPPLSATNHFTLIVTSTNAPPQTNTIPISTIIYTNGGFLLTWFAPSNDLFQVQWSDGLPFTWHTFTNIVSYNTNYPASSTNATFTFFDDGSQAPFTGSRYYQLILLGSGGGNTPPVLPVQTNRTINPLNPLIVTNRATDSDIPVQTLTYTLTSTVTGTNFPAINPTNGIITWTPDVSQAGTSNLFTTVVTDNGTPNLSTTNSFSVIVNPVPGISSVTYSNGGFLLTWFAPTNDIFQVQVATNLASPIVWQTFSNIITYTGPLTPTNGLFSYYDNGSQYPFGGPVRFYHLQLVGIVMPSTTTVPISSIIFTNGNLLLTWFAPTNDQFNVRWSTNLMPPVIWTPFTNVITSTNTIFTFTDTNTPLLLKFYELILLP